MPLYARGNGGIERGPLSPDTTRTSILVAMLTLAIYMALLVNLKVFSTFKRRNTIYFWSLLVTSWGIMSHSLGIILKWFVGSCPWYVNTAFASFGWWGMVTGQSLVLYSRLHLVIRNHRVLRSVLIMIIFNFCVFQVPTTVMTFGSNRADPGMFLTVYNVYERIQLIVFTLQELLISVLYIRAAFKMLLPSNSSTEPLRMTKRSLIYLNVLCIVLDIAFVCEVYSGEWVYKTGTQSLAYAIKLSIEFIVLNKLMDVYRLRPGAGSGSGGAACAACSRKRNESGSKQPPKSGDQHPSEYGYWSRTKPSMVRLGSGGRRGSWPRGRGARGIEPLGPFEEEMMQQERELEEMGGRRGVPHVHAEAGGEQQQQFARQHPGKGIVVTTGIETWSERKESLPLVSPVEEVVAGKI
ncbi:MAG: hypothetical protein LQ338_006217 [Usnochroma carphineum]|nr:MAG: hypothetical protein LQ338_006217 [Usnochroma carphineum]